MSVAEEIDAMLDGMQEMFDGEGPIERDARMEWLMRAVALLLRLSAGSQAIANIEARSLRHDIRKIKR